MSDCLRIALAQLNFLVGDVQGNAARVIAAGLDAEQRRRVVGAVDAGSDDDDPLQAQ